jgi:hypothetical protein
MLILCKSINKLQLEKCKIGKQNYYYFFQKQLKILEEKKTACHQFLLLFVMLRFSSPKNVTETCLTLTKRIPIFSARTLNVLLACQVLHSSVFTLRENVNKKSLFYFFETLFRIRIVYFLGHPILFPRVRILPSTLLMVLIRHKQCCGTGAGTL